MKTLFDFYVVDTISESIVGSFRAVSKAMAKKIIDESILKNDKLGLVKESLKVFYSEQPVLFAETFDEINTSCIEVNFDD